MRSNNCNTWCFRKGSCKTRNDTVRINRINTLFCEIAINSKVLNKIKKDNLLLGCHFGSIVGMITGSSDFLEDVEMLHKFKTITNFTDP